MFESYTEEYSTCIESINTIRNTTDVMTNMVEKFYNNIDETYVYNYFEAFDDGKTYQDALAHIAKYHNNDEVYKLLLEATEISTGLKNTDCYIMKLLVVANGQLKNMVLPADVLDAQLFHIDKLREKEQQLEKANTMLYGEFYQAAKADIHSYIDQAEVLVEERYMSQQKNSTDVLGGYINQQRVLMYCMLVFNVLLFLSMAYFVVFPFRKVLKSFQENKPLTKSGSYEFYILADTYNELYRANMKQQMQLTEKAYLDLHTGLPNKSRCEEVLKNQDLSKGVTCCIMIDLNNLKEVNDKQGHVEGDILIKQFGGILRKAIREEDFVGRYGGDEFVAVLQNVDEAVVKLVINRIEEEAGKYNKRVRMNLEEGQAQISYAYGYAMSNNIVNCSMEVLLNAADSNMYDNKRNIKLKLKEKKNRKPKVLIVDDSQYMREYLLEILKTESYKCAEAADGDEMFRMVEKFQPDIVLLDLIMPVMDGISATSILQKKYPYIKVIACSSQDNNSTRLQAFERGADDFIAKPFDGERVIKSIKKVFYN
ncbi:MAG: response regulator [Lachnospiraceae bacterium]|nr:response regulator [Lachnospiraceae bacterium]